MFWRSKRWSLIASLCICMLICVWQIHMYELENMCLSHFPCYLGFSMNTSFYLSHILRLNKACWLNLYSLHMWRFYTVQECVITQCPDWFYGVIYVCINIFMRETTTYCNFLVLCFWGQNEFVITLLFFIHFVPDFIWKWHAFFLYYIYGI